MNFFNSKFFRLLLPIAGCSLAILFLVSLLSPVITRLKADRNPYNQQITLAENSGQPLPSQSQALRGTPNRQIRFSESGSISLPRPHKEVKEEEELMESANDASTSLQGYMPLLGGQYQNANKPRRMTKAEKKRMEEKRDRQENWAYADPDEVVDDAEKEIWEKKDARDAEEEIKEDETVESIILGDKKNLLIYKFINGDPGDSKDKDEALAAAAASGAKNDVSSKVKLSDSESSAASAANAKSSADRIVSGTQNSPFSKDADIHSKVFSASSASGNNNVWDFFNGSSKSAAVKIDNPFAARQQREQSLNDFRSMISSGSQNPANTTPAANLSERVNISSSTGNLFGTDAGGGNSLPSSPGGITLPGTDNSFTAPPTAAPAARTSPLAPEGRGITREGMPSREIPRLIIRRP